MRTYFRSVSEVLGAPLAQKACYFQHGHAGSHRVLRSTKLEDAVYRDLRSGDDELDALEKGCGKKLSTFSALSRDIYQSFYSLNVRKQSEESISQQARRFNAPILEEVMGGEDYPTIKAACEGRQMLTLMLTSGNTGIVTTHSPYVLGTLNYLMLASQVPTQNSELVKQYLNKRFWLDAEKTNAHYIHDGKLETAINEEDGLKLIKNELIDGASDEINELSDHLLDLFLPEEG